MNPVTKQDLHCALQRLGIGPGCVLGVHSSLSRMGHVEGGAEAVLEALFETVGPAGTIVMSTYLVSPPLELTPEDLARGLTWKIRRIPFDDLATKSGMGAIADTFKRRPDVVRWYHPVHSVTAWGRDAAHFCQSFAPLVQAGGSILLLGVEMDRCSALHLAEERVELPAEVRRHASWEAPPEVAQHYPEDEYFFGCGGAWGDFLIVQREAEARGMIRSTTVGAATARCFEAAPMVDLYEQLLIEDPYRLFGLTKGAQVRGG